MLCVILIGFAAGFQSGLLGVGGGLIMVPAMVFLLGLTQHKSHGTSLAVMPLLVMFGLIEYHRSGNIDWTKAIALAIGGVFGARLANKLSGVKLRRYFALFLLVTGLKMTWDVLPVVMGWHSPAALQPHSLVSGGVDTFLLMLAVGACTGTLSGLLGIGGGILMIPSMVLLLGIPQKMAQGISLAVIIPVSVSGTLIHYAKGNVDTKVALLVGLGGLIGAHLGATLANTLGPEILRLIFGGFVLLISLLMFRGKKEAKDAKQ